MFKSCNNQGFQITLPNGITISTQFGYYSYCDNYVLWNAEFADKNLDDPRSERYHSCLNAEVAIINDKHKPNLIQQFPYSDGHGIATNVTSAQWLEILDFARNLPKEGEEK